MNEMYKAGKFKQLGLSNYASWEVAEIVGICERRGFVKPTVYQGMYNAISKCTPLQYHSQILEASHEQRYADCSLSARALESELEPCLRKFGISLVIYNPLAAGLFSGKYSSLEEPSEGRFSTSNSLGKRYMERYFKQSMMDALAMVEPVAKQFGIPLIEVGLRWCVHHSKLQTRAKGGDDGVILGISSFEQLEQNVEACEKGPLPDEVVQVLDRAWVRVRGDAPGYWR